MAVSGDRLERQSQGTIVSKSISNICTGAVIGFVAAAVLYSRHLPRFVPAMFQNPVAFFGVFIGICGAIGYVWAITDMQMEEKKRRSPLLNVILSGAFSGFLAAAVVYSKFLAKTMLYFNPVFPGVFFVICATAGALINCVWHRAGVSDD